MTNRQLQDFINNRAIYSQTASPQYYANTTGDIHHRERVIQLAIAMLTYFGVKESRLTLSEMAENIIINQSVTEYDSSYLFKQCNHHLFNDLLLLDDEAQQIDFSNKRIYCSYHLGSYRLIVSYLLARGVNIAMLVTNDVAEQQILSIMIQHEEIAHQYPRCGSLNIINAESYQGIDDAIEFYQGGGSLLIYIDGNSGVGGMNRQDNNLLTIPFLSREIKARKGVAFLSHLLAAEICPLFIRNNENGTRVVVHKQSIMPATKQNKKHYIKDTTQALYRILESEISQNICTWEGWLYVEKSACPPALSNKENTRNNSLQLSQIGELNLVFNETEYTVLQYPTTSVLMNKDKLCYQILTSNSARAIRFAQERRNVQHVVSRACINSLLQQKILIVEGASNEN